MKNDGFGNLAILMAIIYVILALFLILCYALQSLKKGLTMKKDEIIKLSDGQTATIISALVNSYIVQLEDGQLRVVDKKTLTLARIQGRV